MIAKKTVQQSLQSYRNHSSAIVGKCCDRYDRWSVVSIWLQRLLNVFSSDSSDGSDDIEASLNGEWQFLMIYLNLEQCCFQGDRGGEAFAFFICPTLGRLTDLFNPSPGNLPCFLKKCWSRGLARCGDGHCWNWLIHYLLIFVRWKRTKIHQWVLSADSLLVSRQSRRFPARILI